MKEPTNGARGPFAGLVDRLRDLVGHRSAGEGGVRAALEEMIEEKENGADPDRLTEAERELLRNALAFGELEVSDVMVPRGDIKAVEIGASLGEVVDAMRKASHSRLLIYKETLDDVVGMVHVKDILPFWGDGAAFTLADIARDVLPVPASMRVTDLLSRMRVAQTHMAIVVDEYGGTDGLVTLEDVVEEIVGDIRDEHDTILAPGLVESAEGGLEADARFKVEDLEERLGVAFLDDERREHVHTLGGLIFALSDRVPGNGEVVRHEPSGVAFEVLDADSRRIKRLRVLPPEPAGAGADAD